jgi:hypothetical protein
VPVLLADDAELALELSSSDAASRDILRLGNGRSSRSSSDSALSSPSSSPSSCRDSWLVPGGRGGFGGKAANLALANWRWRSDMAEDGVGVLDVSG